MTTNQQANFLAYVRGVLRECPTPGERHAALATAVGGLFILGGMKWDEADAMVNREFCGDLPSDARQGGCVQRHVSSGNVGSQVELVARRIS